MRDFNNISKMVEIFADAGIYDYNTKIEMLGELDDVDFFAFIYTLDNGSFNITGFTNKGYLRYFMTSGQTEKENWALDITNNLSYNKWDFLNEFSQYISH